MWTNFREYKFFANWHSSQNTQKFESRENFPLYSNLGFLAICRLLLRISSRHSCTSRCEACNCLCTVVSLFDNLPKEFRPLDRTKNMVVELGSDRAVSEVSAQLVGSKPLPTTNTQTTPPYAYMLVQLLQVQWRRNWDILRLRIMPVTSLLQRASLSIAQLFPAALELCHNLWVVIFEGVLY